MAYRFSGPGQAYEGLVRIKDSLAGEYDPPRLRQWNGNIKFVEKHLLDPLSWKKPRRIFVNSMSDLFHENVTDEMRDKIYAVASMCPHHTLQILTKRPEQMWDYWFLISSQHRLWRISQAIDDLFPTPTKASIAAKERLFEGGPIPNIIHGVSAENQPCFDKRWDILRRFKACGFLTMLSCEPLLSGINLGDAKPDWVIVGGESGPGARPMHPDWARSLRDQCKAAGVPFFFKQWGEWAKCIDRDVDDPDWRRDYSKMKNSKSFAILNLEGGCGFHGDRVHVMQRVVKKAAGCLLDGVEHHEFPAVQA